MSLYEFKSSDILINRLRTHPRSEFFIYDGKVYLNNTSKNSVSLYDGLSGSYPFTYKKGDRYYLKTVKKLSFDEAIFGTTFTGSYPQTSSLSVGIYKGPYPNNRNENIMGLCNSFNSYTPMSRHFGFDTSEFGNKAQQDASVVYIPSIFYGSELKKGTAKCRFYISGTLAAEIHDENKNGEMIQIGPKGSTGSGSVAGVVLYREGFMFLTGSWDLDTVHTETYGSGADNPKWKYFGTTKTGIPSSSFAVEFEGTNDIPVMTMFAHADKGDLNNSSNPTFILKDQPLMKTTGSYSYVENPKLQIKNITTTRYNDTGSFEKTTFISLIGIYDDDRNLIATAKLAKPMRKRERDSYTFKLKIDL
jgi:hypothetical protein